jgi:16S rRNA (adenine1518-N6/adenine1519-N6)-dimethyltransferase
VGSALVSLKLPGDKAKLAISDDQRFLDFVKKCFAQKRKTLVNNLRGIATPEEVKASLIDLGRSAAARAEELSVAQLAALFKELS